MAPHLRWGTKGHEAPHSNTHLTPVSLTLVVSLNRLVHVNNWPYFYNFVIVRSLVKRKARVGEMTEFRFLSSTQAMSKARSAPPVAK